MAPPAEMKMAASPGSAHFTAVAASKASPRVLIQESPEAMVLEQIERLKQEYTGKCVVIDENRPELRRFAGLTGTVVTVNMSGRALVQFDGYNNPGWYDIDIDFLNIIDQPLPKPEEKPIAQAAAKAPAGKKPAKFDPKNMSTAEIIAAARAEKTTSRGSDAQLPAKATAERKPVQFDPKNMSTAEILAAARAEKTARPDPAAETPAEKKPAKFDPKKMSTAEILAAARAEWRDKSGGSSAAPSQPTEQLAVDGPPSEASESASAKSPRTCAPHNNSRHSGLLSPARSQLNRPTTGVAISSGSSSDGGS